MNDMVAALVDPNRHADGSVDEIFREMRAMNPVQRLDIEGYPPFWSVVTHAEALHAYRTPGEYSSARGVLLRQSKDGPDPGAGLTLALTDPPTHASLRRLIAPRFNERCSRAFGEVMKQDIRRVLEDAEALGEVDFARDVAGKLSGVLISRLLGVEDKDIEKVVTWMQEAFALGIPMTSHANLTSFIMDLIYQRMETPAKDAVSLLVEGSVDEREITETELLLNCENLIGASENAGLSLASGIETLLSRPEDLSRLREDQSLLGTACEEILRYASSATHSMRVTRVDSVLGGNEIPANERIVLWVRSANRDELVFDEPEEFRIDRRQNRHLALGAGEHVCIGQNMARHQMRHLLSALLSDVASIEQVGPSTPMASLMVSGPAQLPVKIRLN